MRYSPLLLIFAPLIVQSQLWSAWSDWNGSCKTSGITAISRFRVCIPSKDDVDVSCEGSPSDTVSCSECPAIGTWTEWTAYESCSSNCGGCGRQYRTRSCTSPIGCPPVACVGNRTELQSTSTPCDHQSPCYFPKVTCCSGFTLTSDSTELRMKCVAA